MTIVKSPISIFHCKYLLYEGKIVTITREYVRIVASGRRYEVISRGTNEILTEKTAPSIEIAATWIALVTELENESIDIS